MTPTGTVSAILEGAQLLGRHGGVVEVRIPKTKGTISGYFNDLRLLANAVTRWDGTASLYQTLNPVRPDLLARAHNRLKEFARETTADKDIVRRVWFPVDLDPVRPAGISSTKAEVAGALTRRDEVVAFLAELGFSEPVLAMSGNGAHALYPIDLPNDAQATALIEQGLKALTSRFTDDVVIVDEGVFNAARIWKIYGTTASKGDPTPDRPHRRAVVEHIPGVLTPVDPDALAMLATMAPKRIAPAYGVNGHGPANGHDRAPLDLVTLFQSRGWYLRELHDGKIAVICPWAAEHADTSGLSATVIFTAPPPGGFQCMHSGCTSRTLSDVLRLLRPDEVEVDPAVFEEEPLVGPAARRVPAGHRPLPPGFVARYVEVAMQRTDAPATAHALVAVTVLSALAGPQVRLPLAYRADGVRLVVWSMNLVDSTSGRKTTVNEFGQDVIRQVLGEAAILPWKGSPEAFVQALQARDRQAAVFARDEYSGLLKQMKHGGYVAGLQQDFIRAYDGLPLIFARTKKLTASGARVDDTTRVKEPYLVKLCAATYTSFIEIATIDDVLDGLLARFVFTSGTAPERPMRPMTPAIEAAWQEVVALARGFHERAQDVLRVTLPDAVLAEEWALEQQLSTVALAHPRPDAARPAMKRLAETVLKVAALLALDHSTDGHATVTLADFEAACGLADCWQQTALTLLNDLGRTRFQARADTVLATIRSRARGITMSNLYRAHRGLTQREFDEVLNALVGQGLAHKVKARAPGQAGRTPVVYRAGNGGVS